RSDLFVVRAMGPGNASCSHGSGELRSQDRSRLALLDLVQDRARHAAGGREGRPLVVHRPQEGPSAGIDEGHAGELDADRTRAVRERQGLPAPGKLVHPGAGEPSLEHDGHTFGASHVGDPQHLLPYGASTKNEATTKTGKLGFRWRAGSRMITHQRQLPCRPPGAMRAPEAPFTSRLGPRLALAMPNHHDEMSALADISAAGLRRGPLDTELLHPRLKRGALEAQPAGGTLWPPEHPVALVQRADNSFALRRLERHAAGRLHHRTIAELRLEHAKG